MTYSDELVHMYVNIASSTLTANIVPFIMLISKI